MEFELGKLYTLTDEPGTITRQGRRLIEAFIGVQRINSADWQAVNPTETRIYLQTLPETWAWKWLVQKGEYRGTFPKRVASYYHKRHGIKTPESFNTQIGNLAKTHSQTAETYTFEIVDFIDWEDGDFGDAHSCWWGNNRAAQDMLIDNGGMAIRFYDADNKGFARAWLVNADNLYYVFNGYGLQTVEIAQVFARFMSLDYTNIRLSNNRTDSGVFWINSGTGYVIGETSQIASVSKYDFRFDVIETCESCGRQLGEDQVYRGTDGESYCDNCFYSVYDYCERCGETFYRDDLTYTVDYMICDRCLRGYTSCDGCGDYHRNAHVRSFKGRHFCNNCME